MVGGRWYKGHTAIAAPQGRPGSRGCRFRCRKAAIAAWRLLV